KLKALGREKLAAIVPATNGKVSLVKGLFENLIDDQLQEFAGEKIAGANTVVLIANASSEHASIVFARNESMQDIDCNRIFKQIAGADGRGGGRPHFVTGIVAKEAITRVMNAIANEVMR
ncbi:MAG: hypothetical protein AB1351_08610, partial [Thermoproteota archaeon]